MQRPRDLGKAHPGGGRHCPGSGRSARRPERGRWLSFALSRAHGARAARLFRDDQRAAVKAFGADFVPVLECEPGRGIVAGSTSVLARVKLAKTESRELYLNDGIYGSLMEVYQVPVITPFCRAVRAREGTVEGPLLGWTIYGPTCDPLDRLPHLYDLPANLAEGDYVEFGPLGAYGTATSTRFNGYPPAEIIEVERVLIS